MSVGKWLGTAAIAGALALGGSAVAAPGDVVYAGETEEGVKVKLTVATSGNATKFKVGKVKIDCNEGGRLTNTADTYRGLDRSDPGEFSDQRTTEHSSRRFDFVTKSRLTGTATEELADWEGTLRLSTRVFDGNERIDTCKLNTTWATA